MFFFFKQTTAYERRISDWSSDVCSSDLPRRAVEREGIAQPVARRGERSRRPLAQRQRRAAVAHRADAEIERLWRARRYPPFDEQRKIGRASCRERVCQYV